MTDDGWPVVGGMVTGRVSEGARMRVDGVREFWWAGCRRDLANKRSMMQDAWKRGWMDARGHVFVDRLGSWARAQCAHGRVHDA